MELFNWNTSYLPNNKLLFLGVYKLDCAWLPQEFLKILRDLVTFFASSDLNKGVTFAIFKILQKVPRWREGLKVKSKIYLISPQLSRIMFDLIVCIPAALLRFKDLKAVSNYSAVKL